MKPYFSHLKKELQHVVPATLFFFILLSMVHITELVIGRPSIIRATSFWSVGIAAIIMGKIVIITNYLPWIAKFEKKPLIYSIAWKSSLYWFMSLIIHNVERIISMSFELKNISDATEKVLESMTTPEFFVCQMWLFVTLLTFVAYYELITTIGYEKVRKLFFG